MSKGGMKIWVIENIVMRLGDLLLGTDVIKQLNYHREICLLNSEEIQNLQNQKLKAVLKHAVETCNSYRIYANAYDADCQKWLQKFPIIKKADINSNLQNLLSSKFKIKDLIKCDSSGSTGIRSTVYIDKKEQSITRAITILWWEWNGYFLGKPLLQTGMTLKRGIVKGVKDWVLNTKYLNAFDLSETEVLSILYGIKGKKNMHFFGYASSLYEIAKIAIKNNVRLKFDLAMSQGDKLFDHYAKTINQAFDCEVVEDYGMTEGFMVGQKKDLPFFYIYTPNVFLEILDQKDQPVKDGEIGRIILTKLDGYAMPLIRYDTGDLGVVLPKERYPAKRDLAFPLLEKVIGRNTDIIKTLDGKTFIVHTFTGIFEFYEEIEQFQVIQYNLESITICYIPAISFYPEVIAEIEKDIRGRTQSSIRIIWKKVDEIKPSKSGKPQIVINHLVSKSLSDII